MKFNNRKVNERTAARMLAVGLHNAGLAVAPPRTRGYYRRRTLVRVLFFGVIGTAFWLLVLAAGSVGGP